MKQQKQDIPHLAAAIDIGSNAFRLLIGARQPDGAIVALESYREPIRLGTDVFRRRTISQRTMREALAAFDRFHLILRRHRIASLRAVGTSALREATNGATLIAAIKKRTGISLEIISGEEEARLAYVAVNSQIPLATRSALLVDIGGGSVELTFVKNGAIVAAESVKMGAVRLMQLLERRPQGEKIFHRLAESYIQGLERRLRRQLGPIRIPLCIGTGGNVEAFGDLKTLLFGGQSRSEISRTELEKVTKIVREMPCSDRIAVLGLKPDRADVVVPALLIMSRVMRFAGATKLEIPRVGIKDGLLRELLALRGSIDGGERRKQLVTFALELGRKFLFDEPHATLVSRLSLQFFDSTKKLHGLNGRERQLLEIAALLHDIGQFVHYGDHHKHSYYLIAQSSIIGLTRREREIVALIARYHRKSTPKKSHPEYMALTPGDRRMVCSLAAILRLGDALDCSHAGRVQEIRAQILKKKMVITLTGSDKQLLLERWALQRKGELFTKIFGLKIVVA